MSVDLAPSGLVCDPCTDTRWEALAAAEGRLFHSPAWLRVLRDGLGLTPQAALVGEGGRAGGGRARGGLAWVEIRDLRGRRVRCLPFSDFGGPIGDLHPEDLVRLGADVWPRIDQASMRVLVRCPEAGSTTKSAGALGLSLTGKLAWHWTDVRHPDGDGVTTTGPSEWEETSADPMWTALSAKARQNIRRARRSGVEITVDGSSASLHRFRLLHQRLRRDKYRLLSQPAPFFDAIHQHFAPRPVGCGVGLV